MAASLEQSSEHPLARAVVDYAKDKKYSLAAVEGFESVTGAGIKGKVSGNGVLLGKENFLKESGIELADDLRQKAQELQNKAQTVVWVAMENRIVGILAIFPIGTLYFSQSLMMQLVTSSFLYCITAFDLLM